MSTIVKPGRCHIGTSGWSYSHWAKGRFYPKGLKQSEWLAFFSRHFGTVEINMSFYRVPKPEMVSRWSTVTGSRFRFAVKLWRRITHEKRLGDCSDQLRFFFGVVNELGTKRAPLLVQLPPSLRRDAALLEAFLADLRQAARPARWKVAVEFRNSDWLCEPVYELLDRHRAAVALADMPRCPITEPNEARFVYVRRHGPGGRYRGCYTRQHLSRDADRICQWLDQGRNVYVYFNNDIEGHAIDNARTLSELVG